MVTWQGSSPRSRPSASPARRRSPQRAGTEPGDDDHGQEEALVDAGGLVDAAEAELDPGIPCAAPDPAELDRARAERRRADQRMVEAVLEEGLGGPRHQALENELFRYAVLVLRHLLADGRLVSKASRLGAPPVPASAWLDFTADDREEFAHEMVIAALPGFARVVFEERRWKPGRGASLKTYFVNACILQFARIQAQWLASRQAVRPAGLELDPDAFPAAPDPAATVIVRDEVARVLSKMQDKQLREVMVLRGAGWTEKDAAREAGLTQKAAETRLARFRRTLREDREETGPHASRRSDTTQGGR